MAKKKQLNRRVVVLLVCLGAVLLLGVAGAIIYMRPGDPVQYAKRADQALAAKKYSEANELYGKALSLDKRNAQYFIAYGNVKEEWLNNDRTLTQAAGSRLFWEANSCYREATRYAPENAEAWRKLITMQEFALSHGGGSEDRIQEYVNQLDSLIKLDPSDLGSMLKRAEARSALAVAHPEMAAQAEADYRSLVEKKPQEEEYWISLAHFFFRQRKLDEADKVYQEAIKANPKSGRILVSYSGFLMVQPDRRKDALKAAQQAVAVQPDFVDGYLQVAGCYQNEKQLDKALETLNLALQKDPNKAIAYLSMSSVYAQQKQPEKAEAILTKGVEQLRQMIKEGKAKDTELNLYRTGLLQLDYTLAEALMDRVRAKTVTREVAKPKLEEILKEMQGVVAHHPLVDAVNGRLLMLDGNNKDAEAILAKIYESSHDPKIAQLLIDIYNRLNQPGDAQKIFETYLKSAEPNVGNLLAMARIYCDYRQYDQAERTVKEAAKLDGANEDVKTMATAIAVARGQENRIPLNLKEIDSSTMRMFFDRAQTLWTEGDQDQAIALMGDVHARAPQSLEAAVQLVLWLRQRNDTAKADEVVKQTRELLAAKPDSLRELDVMLEMDPAKRLEIVLKDIDERVKDPSDRALARFDVFLEVKQEEKALAEVKPVEEKDPNNPALIEKLFNYYAGKGDWDKARKYADLAAKLDIDQSGGKLYQAILDLNQNHLDQAIATLNEVVRARPKFHMAHALLGECYLRQQNMDKAHEEYLLAYEQNPKNTKALLGLMQVAEATGKTAEYEQYLTQAYKFMPSYPPVREKYLELQEAKQDPEKLIKQRELMLKGQSGKEPLNLMNAARLALLYEKAKQTNKADQVYRMMAEAAPDNPMVIRLLADFLRRTDRDVEAGDVLAKYVERSPEKTTGYLMWSEHLEKSGRIDQAKGMFEKAMQADKNGIAFDVYAAFSERHADYAEAVKALQEVVKRAKTDADRVVPLRRQIFDMIYAGSFDAAQEQINRLLQANRSDADAMGLQGILYMRKPGLDKGLEKARESLDAAIAIDNQNLQALTHRAELLFKMGEGALAAQDLESARHVKGASSENLSLKLAAIYDSIGDSAGADGVLQTLLNDQPSNLGALRLRAELATKNQAWPRLEQVLAEAEKQFPKDPDFPAMEAQMWRSRGQSDKAMEALGRAAKVATGDDQNELGLQACQLMLDTGQYDRVLQTAATLAADKKVGPRAVALTARAKAKKGDAAGAQADFEAAIRSAGATEVGYVMGQVEATYKPAQVVPLLAKWIGLRPDCGVLYYQMSISQLNAGDAAGSLESAKQAVSKAVTPNDKLIGLTQEAVVAESMKQYDLAVLCFQEGLRQVPGDVATLNNVAFMLTSHLNRHAEALPFAEKAARMMPSNAGILDTYGLVLLNVGKLDEAESVLKRGLDLQPMASSRLFLGNVYEKQGQKDKALEQYKLGWQMVTQTPKDANYQPLADAVKRVGGTP